MSATHDLLQDHVFIRRLQAVIEKCYALLHENKDVPSGDLIKITDMIEQFVDQFTKARRRKTTFRKQSTRIVIQRRSASS